MWMGWLVGVALAGGRPRPVDRLDAAELRIQQMEETLAALVASASAEAASRAAGRHEADGIAQALAGVEREMLALRADLDGLRLALETPASKTGARLALLEAEVKRLTEAAAAKPTPTPTPSVADEDAATALLSQAKEAVLAFDTAAVRKALDTLDATYRETRANRSAERLRGELAVVGSRPGEPTVSKWFTSPTTVAGHRVTLLVFWEEWCPHCQREVPRLTQWADTYGAQGLQVLALTRMTKGVTEAEVAAFVDTHDLRFPIGLEDGKYAEALDVKGIPAAALVKDGAVVWRGHPATLDAAAFERLLAP